MGMIGMTPQGQHSPEQLRAAGITPAAGLSRTSGAHLRHPGRHVHRRVQVSLQEVAAIVSLLLLTSAAGTVALLDVAAGRWTSVATGSYAAAGLFASAVVLMARAIDQHSAGDRRSAGTRRD